MSKIKLNCFCVKITVYKGYFADKVVYYRGCISIDTLMRWRWFFEYLAARIKVKNPKRTVKLTICPQTLLLGDEYVEQKIINLLRSKRSKLQKLMNTPIAIDLFNFNQIDVDKKIEQTRAEIAALEGGVYTGWVPPYYINEIKRWI